MTQSMLERPAAQAPVNRAVATTLEEWRAAAGNRLVPVNVSAEGSFSGTITWRSIEGASLSEIIAEPHRVHRAPELIDSTERPYIKLSLQMQGTGYLTQGERHAELRAGDLAIYETSRPYSLEFPAPLRCMVMAFPLESLNVPLSLIRRITAVRLPGDEGIGQMISPFMQHVAEHLDELSGVTGARLLRSTLDLLAAFVYAQLPEDSSGEGHSRREELRAYKLYIDEHLYDPELSASTVAKAHYVSVRYLQYLFSEEDITVSGYIRSRRLEKCRLDLSDPAQASLSVLQIAQRWGFTDASHFSKVFRAHTGASPRTYRAAHLAE
ncbi:helix-turn-helix domain-containing protein [Nesterenkonia sp. MY13]|uniref:Helix-turn-helix domain-containing protein n=1 Tax=Nesterenkonia sedimenti TaxID=1463632 RepID=A0A7X8YED6_9MICC|nr:helix-turn-helix domain-containing protein [Nesterenkonia sedimenti]NLS10703.1 helix-turn-helix domain-containing protein [Nesterenkonia sedimenti]